jgi:hypothetical protein
MIRSSENLDLRIASVSSCDGPPRQLKDLKGRRSGASPQPEGRFGSSWAPQGSFKQIAEAGWIRSIVSLPGLVDRYDPGDLQALLDSLLCRRQFVTAVEKDMSPVLSAPARCHCKALEILNLIRNDRPAFVGRLPNVFGVPALLVRPSEILEALATPQLEGCRHTDLKRTLGLSSSTVSLLMRTGGIECEEH